ncbi:MAG: hypothetical protein KDD53_12320, partial [Bdellovibrionales bacterium]|nr:hypothetical protein [Bdellovibrionales bacterium]
MGFFRRLSILAPFALRGVSVKAFERNINLVRILFGLGLVHRYVDMLGYSVVSGRPESMIDHSILSIVFSVMIALGFLTPVGLIGLNVIYFIPKFFVPYLGTQVAIVVCWGLLFFGAGRRYSIDAMLSDFIPVLRKPLRIVYTFAIEPGAGRYISEQATAWVRFVSIASYWGICYVAMAFHFRDALWLDGRVLQTAFTTSYLTDFYGIFRYMAEAYPTLFDIFFTTALLVQGIWETFLLPLMFFRWGRVFVVIQGTGFFLV